MFLLHEVSQTEHHKLRRQKWESIKINGFKCYETSEKKTSRNVASVVQSQA